MKKAGGYLIIHSYSFQMSKKILLYTLYSFLEIEFHTLPGTRINAESTHEYFLKKPPT